MKACKMVSVVAVALGGVLLLPLEGARDGRDGRGGHGGARGYQAQPRTVRVQGVRSQPNRHYRNYHTYRRGEPRRSYHRSTTVRTQRPQWSNTRRYVTQRYPRTVWYSYPSYTYSSPYYSRSGYYRSMPYGAGYDGYYSYRVPRAVRVYATELPPVAGSLEVEVQLALRRLGFYRGPIDGIMGRGTWRAIRAFRASVGLPVTSDVDGELLRALGFSY